MLFGAVIVALLLLLTVVALREQARTDALPRCGDCHQRLGDGVATCPACGGRRR